MAKQEKLEFDYEEFFDETFERSSVLMWVTHLQAFTFAFYLNQIYNIRLERRENVVLHNKKGDLDCTVFSYQDNVSHIVYFLIDSRNETPSGTKKTIIFDKTLLIIGPDARLKGEYIYKDLDEHRTNTDNYVNRQRDELRDTFVGSGIFESALFDFSDPDEPRSTYFPTSYGNTEKEKKSLRFLKEHREYITDLFMALDSMMPDLDAMTDD